MSEMIKVYQEINKRRQADNMDVNSLTMFAESWDFQQAKIDDLQARIDGALKSIMICEEYNHAEKLDEIYNILKAVEK